MDEFTTDARKIGVPCHHLSYGDGQTRTVIQQMVSNVNVVSNVPGLSGSGLTGNVEVSLFMFLCHWSFLNRLLTDLLAPISSGRITTTILTLRMFLVRRMRGITEIPWR